MRDLPFSSSLAAFQKKRRENMAYKHLSSLGWSDSLLLYDVSFLYKHCSSGDGSECFS